MPRQIASVGTERTSAAVGERVLEVVDGGVDAVDARMGGLAVARWVDIGTAREHECVDASPGARFGSPTVLIDDGLRPRARDRVEVGAGERGRARVRPRVGAAEAAPGDRDDHHAAALTIGRSFGVVPSR